MHDTISHPSNPALSDTTFEQSAGAAQQPMRCGGWGEQWACFVIGILIWPLWWVASVAVEGWQVAQGAWL